MRSVSFIADQAMWMASYRYRTLIPAHQLCADINNHNAGIIVWGKPGLGDAEHVQRLKANGQTVIADFCDNHFDHPQLGPAYRRIAEIADICTAPTTTMAALIPVAVGKKAVIPDPYEMPEESPHADGDKILWFGHNAGLKALYYQPPNLTVVTGPQVKEGWVPYSLESLREEMRKANIAIFPTIKGHEYKSPNRLVNALRMGLFPVCDRHPSYEEFKDFIYMSEVPTGIKWAREFKHELNVFVKQGQDYIRDRFSPEAIGMQWKELLEAV
jgi:hypothetical protein